EYFEPDEKLYNAFVDYLTLGLKGAKRFSLSLLTSRHEHICHTYEANMKMAKDGNSEYTRRALKAYNQLTIEKTGTLFVDYSTIPNEYVHFIEAASNCAKFGITPETYIEAQFEGLQWTGSIP